MKYSQLYSIIGLSGNDPNTPDGIVQNVNGFYSFLLATIFFLIGFFKDGMERGVHSPLFKTINKGT